MFSGVPDSLSSLVEALSNEEILLWLGVGLLGLLILQGLLGLFRVLRANAIEARMQRLELGLLQQRVERETLLHKADIQHKALDWQGWRKFEIAHRKNECDGVESFYLVPHDGKPLPTYQPGQFLTFNLKIPGQNKPVVRCYSLSDSPFKKHTYRVSVKQMMAPPNQPDTLDGVGSGFFHQHLWQSDIVDVKSPNGDFYLNLREVSPIVLIAGGIGMTPMMSMLTSLVDLKSSREVWLFYGVRNSLDHYQKAAIAKMADAHKNIQVRTYYSEALETDHQGFDFDHHGFINIEAMQTILPHSNYDFYVCGPPPMMQAVVAGLQKWGVADDQVHFETFGPASFKKPVGSAESDSLVKASSTFTVKFIRSGRTLEWDASKGSLLDLADDHQIDVDTGCRAGSCGTCKTAVMSGKVEYLEAPSMAVELGSCLICLAIPGSNIELDA